MQTHIFCNIGTRDVIREGDSPTDRRPTARERGQALLAAGPAIYGELRFQISQPAIDEVLSRVAHGRVPNITFIGTDQPPPPSTEQRFYDNDTLYYAQLAANYFQTTYGDRLGEVRVHLIEDINPSLYDEAMTAYAQLLTPHADGQTTCYLLPSGGVPACGTAMLIQGVRLFQSACHVVYQPDGSDPWPLNVGQQISGVMRENTLHTLLNRFDFAAAHAVWAAEPDAPPLALALLQAADARLHFDFTAAQKHLQDAQHLPRLTTAAKQALRDQLTAVRLLTKPPTFIKEETTNTDPVSPLIGELYHNARLTWLNGRYVDFLGRAIRFQEAVLTHLAQRQPLRQYLLDQLLAPRPTSTTDLPADQQSHLRHVLQDAYSLTELRGICFDLAIDHENFQPTKDAFIIDLLAHIRRRNRWADLISAAQATHAEADLPPAADLPAPSFEQLYTALARLEHLRPDYEQSIIGHGLRGVSAAALTQTYAADHTPLADMATICQLLDIPLLNPFRALRDLLLTLVREHYG